MMCFSFIFVLPSCVDSVEDPNDEQNESEEIFGYIKTNIDPIFLESDSLEELEERLDEISQIEGVEAAYISGNALCVKFDDGRLASWIMFPDSAENEETKSSSTTLADADVFIRPNLSACIILQVSNDENFSDEVDKYYELEKDFKNQGVATRVVLAPEFTRSFVRTEMSSYDIVIMVTHGMWNVEGTDHRHGILLGEEFKFSMLLADDKIDSGNVTEKRNGKEDVTKGYVMLDEDYLGTALGNFKDNSIVFNVACASLKGNKKMAEMFKKKGAGAYLGYNDTNCKPLSPYYFFKNMLKGMTVQEALEAMPSDYKNDVHLDHPKVPHSAKLLNAISSGNNISISMPTSGKWVDLGLSVLWAGWNVGANSPGEYGGYYAWGETQEKSVYNMESYTHVQSLFYGETLGWHLSYVDIGKEISGTPYDVAHVKWGDGARMPTHEEIKELTDNCTFKEGTYKGVKGGYVIGHNGNSIFLPFAGARGVDDDLWGIDENFSIEGITGTFWSGTNGSGDEGYNAWYLWCSGYSGGDGCNAYREFGLSVRPVKDK